MNELDKRIAELKGLWWDDAENCVWLDPPVPINKHGIMDAGRNMVSIGHFSYSTDERAFELVDELMDTGPGWSFHLDSAMLNREKLKDSGFKIAERAENWNCSFMHGLMICMGGGKSRPEAICRAYIAAREWMATKECA